MIEYNILNDIFYFLLDSIPKDWYMSSVTLTDVSMRTVSPDKISFIAGYLSRIVPTTTNSSW